MPHCVTCKTIEGVELYKGRFFCPDHRGTTIPFVDPLENSIQSQKAEIIREYLKRKKEKENYTIRLPYET